MEVKFGRGERTCCGMIGALVVLLDVDGLLVVFVDVVLEGACEDFEAGALSALLAGADLAVFGSTGCTTPI